MGSLLSWCLGTANVAHKLLGEEKNLSTTILIILVKVDLKMDWVRHVVCQIYHRFVDQAITWLRRSRINILIISISLYFVLYHNGESRNAVGLVWTVIPRITITCDFHLVYCANKSKNLQKQKMYNTVVVTVKQCLHIITPHNTTVLNRLCMQKIKSLT